MSIDKSFNNSPYWSHVNKKGHEDSDRPFEDVRANPDGLSEASAPWLPRYTEVQQAKLAAIQDSFSSLTDTERRIIVLIYTENLTQKEIGKRLKLSQQMVSKELNRARKKIKKIYGSKGAF